MNWALLILAPILGSALLAGVAFLIARVANTPLEIVAESSGLSSSQNSLLFPNWAIWSYFLIYVGFLCLHFILARSFELPARNWPVFATVVTIGIVGLVYYSRILISLEPGKLRSVAVLMAAGCAGALTLGAIGLFMTFTSQTPKPNKASLSTPAPPSVRSVMTVQSQTYSRSLALGQV